MNIKLQHKNALVCGSSQGIGKSIAMEFAESGANVTLLARNREALELVLKELNNDGTQKHSYICSDIADIESIESEIKKRKESYDILVNNTGGPAPGILHEAKTEDLETAFKNHIIAAQRLALMLVQEMKEKKFGRILNIISVGLKQPIMNLGISNTIRGAMGSWAKTLASELGPFGITVNNILPGYTNTERLNHLFEHRSKIENVSIEEVKAGIVNEVPAKRLGEPNEIGYLACFLASENASYINGINLPIDGGFLRTL